MGVLLIALLEHIDEVLILKVFFILIKLRFGDENLPCLSRNFQCVNT